MIRRAAAGLAAIALAAGILTGCGGSPAALSESTSATMQASVVAVAESAAAGDPEGALARLDELQAQLDGAIAGGAVSAARASSIQDAIGVVRADLEDAAAPEPSATPTPTPVASTVIEEPDTSDGTDATDGTDANTGNSGTSNSGPGNNNGNGNGNGNGKDKGKDKGKGK